MGTVSSVQRHAHSRHGRFVRIVAVATVLATLFLNYAAQPVGAIQTKPPTDWSFYVLSINLSEAYQLGYNQGQYDNANDKNSEVILDFGAQAFSGSTEGTVLTFTQSFASHASIQNYVQEFARGWWYGNPNDRSILTIGVGTNNSRGERVDYGGGQAWANVVSAIRSYVASQGWNLQILVWGANDIEPGFSLPGDAFNWANGYASVNPAPYITFGSADGCPTASSSNGACNNGWYQYHVWYLSWGISPALALPEIYFFPNNPVMANQWSMISLYSAQYQNGRIYFEGPLDQYTLDTSSNTSQTAWDQLWTAINNNPATASDLTHSAQIHLTQ